MSAPAYAFCEPVTASGRGRWHLRKLDAAGLKPGGGITTRSLCGYVKTGWDLEVEITEHHLGHACSACVGVYRAEVGRG